jgi:hypothetical protein
MSDLQKEIKEALIAINGDHFYRRTHYGQEARRNALKWLSHQQELIEQLQEREFNHYPIVIHDLESRIFAQQDLLEQKDAEIAQLREVLNIRPEVLWFAVQMELKLRENDHKGGWSEEHESWLLDELYRNAGKIREDRGIVRAVNTANFAMMIADNTRNENEQKGAST